MLQLEVRRRLSVLCGGLRVQMDYARLRVCPPVPPVSFRKMVYSISIRVVRDKVFTPGFEVQGKVIVDYLSMQFADEPCSTTVT